MVYTREEYMKDKCTHREYYAQFVTDEIKGIVKATIGESRLLASKDEHLNDIPLKQWDNMYMPALKIHMETVGDYLTQAGKVCILKEAARQIIEKTKGEPPREDTATHGTTPQQT